MAQDEVHWVLRHVANPPSRRHNVKLPQEDFNDRSRCNIMNARVYMLVTNMSFSHLCQLIIQYKNNILITNKEETLLMS